jgi:2-keto-4-pentenoate hydratase
MRLGGTEVALSAEEIKDLAHALHKAEHMREPVEPLTARYPEITPEEAYFIQIEGISERLQAHGGRIVGWKVGLTSRAMQLMLNVNQPEFGHLLDSMLLDPGAEIDAGAMIWPRVEPEVAFVLKADVRGPDATAAQVLEATEYLVPALEIIDTRIKDWKVKLCDTIADNASCGRFLLGKDRTPPQGLDVKLLGMNYYVDRSLVSTATAAAVLGDPAQAVAWLANSLAPFGRYLESGQVVLPGSLVAAVDAKPGSTVHADFDHIGSVELRVR